MPSDFLRYLSYALGPIGGVYRAVGNVKKVLPSLDSNKGFAENLLSFVGSSLGSTAAQDIYNKYTGAGLTSAEKESIEQQRYLRQTTYQDQVQSMQDAGLNPAMMYGGGASVTTPSLSLPSQQGISFSDLMQIALLPTQIKNLKSDIELKKSQANELNSRAGLNVQLQDFNSQINPLRVKAQELANNVTAAEERRIYKTMEEISANIGKVIAETKSEEERKALIVAQSLSEKAKAYQIYEMLPYQKMLAEAQTSAQRAAAALSAVNEAYQKRLLNSDYLDNMFAEMSSRASSAESRAQMDAIRASIRNGTFGVSELGDNVIADTIEAIQSFGAQTLAGFVNFVDNLNPFGSMLK